MNLFVLFLILFLICGIGLFIVLKPKKQPGSPTCKDYIVLEPTITKDKCIAPSYCWDTTCHSKPSSDPGPDPGCSGFSQETNVDNEPDCIAPNLCWKEGVCYGKIDCNQPTGTTLPAPITQDGTVPKIETKIMTQYSKSYKTIYISGNPYCQLDKCDDKYTKTDYWCKPSAREEDVTGCTGEQDTGDKSGHIFPDSDASWYTHWYAPEDGKNIGKCVYKECKDKTSLVNNLCLLNDCGGRAGQSTAYPITDGNTVGQSSTPSTNTTYRSVVIGTTKACQFNGCTGGYVQHRLDHGSPYDPYCVPGDFEKSGCTGKMETGVQDGVDPTRPNTVWTYDYDSSGNKVCIFAGCDGNYAGPKCDMEMCTVEKGETQTCKCKDGRTGYSVCTEPNQQYSRCLFNTVHPSSTKYCDV